MGWNEMNEFGYSVCRANGCLTKKNCFHSGIKFLTASAVPNEWNEV